MASRTSKAITDFKDRLEVRAEAAEGIEKGLYEGLSYLPGILSSTGRQVYTNYLGWNPKSIMQNIASPYIMMLGEVGPTKATKLYIEATLDLLKYKKSGGNINKLLTEEGLLAPQWTGEVLDGLRASAKKSSIADLSSRVLDKYEKAMMAGFEGSEKIARATNYFMSKRLAREALQNEKTAEAVWKSLDPAYQRLFKNAYKSEDLATAEKVLADYFNANNMFHYDRINMSEYGRQMGPLFSVFSKWPTHIGGKIMQEYRDKGIKKGSIRTAQTLLAPYLGLHAIDSLTRPENNDAYNNIVGKAGFAGWTPMDSVISVAQRGPGGIAETPFWQMTKAVKDAVKDDKSMLRWLKDSYLTFGYGAGLFRVLGEELPAISGRRLPKKGHRLDRYLKEIERTRRKLK